MHRVIRLQVRRLIGDQGIGGFIRTKIVIEGASYMWTTTGHGCAKSIYADLATGQYIVSISIGAITIRAVMTRSHLP